MAALSVRVSTNSDPDHKSSLLLIQKHLERLCSIVNTRQPNNDVKCPKGSQSCTQHHLTWHWEVIDDSRSLFLPATAKQTMNHFLVPDGFKSSRLLGRGSFGMVFELCDAKQKQGSKAVKILWVASANNSSLVDTWSVVFREVYMLDWLAKQLHGMIVPFYGCSAFGNHISITMKRYDHNVLDRSIDNALHYLTLCTPDQIRKWSESPVHVLRLSECRQMFRILLALKSQGVIHGDAKPDQFLFDKSTGGIVLSDFGCSGFTERNALQHHAEVIFGSAGKQRIHVLVPKIGWPSVYPLYFDLDCQEPKPSAKAIAHFDLWSLDVYLWFYKFWIWDDVNGSKQTCTPYGRLSHAILPADVETECFTYCTRGDTLQKHRLALSDECRKNPPPDDLCVVSI